MPWTHSVCVLSAQCGRSSAMGEGDHDPSVQASLGHDQLPTTGPSQPWKGPSSTATHQCWA